MRNCITPARLISLLNMRFFSPTSWVDLSFSLRYWYCAWTTSSGLIFFIMDSTVHNSQILSLGTGLSRSKRIIIYCVTTMLGFCNIARRALKGPVLLSQGLNLDHVLVHEKRPP